ncbi:MAG: hypothetical protein RLY49_575 [Candidatus Parcubacteria bacterium]|jgi:nucleoside 2-deoxyribosyltransferase
MINKRLKVYVACALTYVPKAEKQTFTQLLQEVKTLLEKENFEVIEFLSAIKNNPEAEEVYSFDIDCLEKADCLLALGDFPGTGLGYEICYSTELKVIPTMVGVKNKNNISKLLQGISHSNYSLVEFDTPEKLVSAFVKFVK